MRCIAHFGGFLWCPHRSQNSKAKKYHKNSPTKHNITNSHSIPKKKCRIAILYAIALTVDMHLRLSLVARHFTLTPPMWSVFHLCNYHAFLFCHGTCFPWKPRSVLGEAKGVNSRGSKVPPVKITAWSIIDGC